jgi:hypothetical protein
VKNARHVAHESLLKCYILFLRNLTVTVEVQHSKLVCVFFLRCTMIQNVLVNQIILQFYDFLSFGANNFKKSFTNVGLAYNAEHVFKSFAVQCLRFWVHIRFEEGFMSN